MKLFQFSIFIVLSLFTSLVFAQEDTLVQPDFEYDKTQNLQPVSFNEAKIEDYKNDSDFDYSEIKKEQSAWAKFKRWVSNLWDEFWHWLLGDYKASSFWAVFIEILPYLILFIIICFVVYLFIKLNPAGNYNATKETGEVFLSEEEKIIYNEDINQLIAEALENKQYRLAIRYSYLLVLRELKNKEIINYQFQKTNHDYLAEIESEQLNLQFKKITKWYDFVWYGDFSISEKEYEHAAKDFTAIKNQLS
ncbi:DUF4129 domain-containing protein [Mesonia sp.]|uniref:DUF4129 domain-containing protein n=1 Tax=Mesonia sp. TaxID=1960830 RepID=UPI00176091A9|nr:DUF4129 domain-containing protein [Mesonia sp.]HIB37548.1 DUF4129 domain-containing protein [Mesonia sp.]HIO27770.1 DUF4129 domain-containing protein [Flavobacteriaceae bacterium]